MSLQLFSPWPTVSRGGSLAGGSVLDPNEKCRVCEHHKCKDFHSQASANLNCLVCPKGLNCYAHKDKETIVFIGLVDPDRTSISVSSRRNKRYHVSPVEVRRWIDHTNKSIATAHLQMDAETERSIQGLHNIQPVVNMVVRAAERSIYENAGVGFNEKLENADDHQRDVYYAADLLTWMINLQQDLVRPESIAHGSRSPQPVYEILDRFVRSFRLLASSQKKSIRIEGTCHARPRCHESVATLFFVLLHNAVKYSLENQQILVRINDNGHAVEIQVESFGPLIKPGERGQIFDAGYRGENARHFSVEGSGRGLYVAKLIADKHGTFVECQSSSAVHTVNDFQCGTNIFTVRLYR